MKSKGKIQMKRKRFATTINNFFCDQKCEMFWEEKYVNIFLYDF